VSEDWQIRGACQADAAQIAWLAGVLGYPGETHAMDERLGELLRRPDHRIAVAAGRYGHLGGWLHVARHVPLESGAFAEILGLIVDPQVRRAGLGRALVAEAERWAALHHLARLAVRSNVMRSESHAFYPSLGFTRSKSQHVYAKLLGEAVPGSQAGAGAGCASPPGGVA